MHITGNFSLYTHTHFVDILDLLKICLFFFFFPCANVLNSHLKVVFLKYSGHVYVHQLDVSTKFIQHSGKKYCSKGWFFMEVVKENGWWSSSFHTYFFFCIYIFLFCFFKNFSFVCFLMKNIFLFCYIIL